MRIETRSWRLARSTRTALLTAHITASAGWFGFGGALIAFEVAALRTRNPGLRTGLADVTTTITWQILTPLVCVSLGTGVVLSLGTSWGVARYWWVVAKTIIAFAVTVTGAVMLAPRLPHVLTGQVDPIQPLAVAGQCAAMVALLAAMALSVAKPWGRTSRRRPGVEETPQAGQQTTRGDSVRVVVGGHDTTT
ncbi:MAG: hypothetical protein ACRDS0_29480 [Pseudonocardiaceae bacterium]